MIRKGCFAVIRSTTVAWQHVEMLFQPNILDTRLSKAHFQPYSRLDWGCRRARHHVQNRQVNGHDGSIAPKLYNERIVFQSILFWSGLKSSTVGEFG